MNHGSSKGSIPGVAKVSWKNHVVQKFESLFHTLCYHNQIDNVSEGKEWPEISSEGNFDLGGRMQ